MSVVEELKNKTVFELKSYAKQNNIDIFGVSKKVEILEIILNFIPKQTSEPAVKQKTQENHMHLERANILFHFLICKKGKRNWHYHDKY